MAVASLIAMAILVAMLWLSHRPYIDGLNHLSPYTISSVDASRGVASLYWTYPATLTARHVNAWQAKQNMEYRLNILRKLVLSWKATMSLGDVRYTYIKSKELKNRTEFNIIYHINITIPASVSLSEVEEVTARLGLRD